MTRRNASSGSRAVSTQTLRTRSLSSSFPECKHNSSRSVTTRTAHLLHMCSVTSDSMAKASAASNSFTTRRSQVSPVSSFSKETRAANLTRLRDRCEGRPNSHPDDRSDDSVPGRTSTASCGATITREIRQRDRARSAAARSSRSQTRQRSIQIAFPTRSRNRSNALGA